MLYPVILLHYKNRMFTVDKEGLPIHPNNSKILVFRGVVRGFFREFF